VHTSSQVADMSLTPTTLVSCCTLAPSLLLCNPYRQQHHVPVAQWLSATQCSCSTMSVWHAKQSTEQAKLQIFTFTIYGDGRDGDGRDGDGRDATQLSARA
jgi:hypothetical protein